MKLTKRELSMISRSLLRSLEKTPAREQRLHTQVYNKIAREWAERYAPKGLSIGMPGR